MDKVALELLKINVPATRDGELSFQALSEAISDWDLITLLDYAKTLEQTDIFQRTPLLLALSDLRISAGCIHHQNLIY